MDGETQPVEGGESTPTTPVTPAPKPEDTIEFWKEKARIAESRYNGQQGAVNRITNEKTQALKDKDTLAQQLETEKATLTAQINALAAEKTTLEQKAAQLEAEKLGFVKRQEIGATIHKDFPELSDLYNQGLLLGVENLEGEALTTHLTTLKTAWANQQAALEAQRRQQATNYFKGASPTLPTTPTPSGGTTDELYDALSSMDPADPNYKPLMDQYMEGLKRKEATS